VAQSPRGQTGFKGDPGGLYCVGFAAESHDLLARTPRAKRVRKGVPLLVGNIGPATFGRTTTRWCWWTPMGATEVPRASKLELARKLIAEIARSGYRNWVHEQ
jgi:phosphopantothenoylcysteine decarboxylase/phosphopantothenate--cysteine ligase